MVCHTYGDVLERLRSKRGPPPPVVRALSARQTAFLRECVCSKPMGRWHGRSNPTAQALERRGLIRFDGALVDLAYWRLTGKGYEIARSL